MKAIGNLLKNPFVLTAALFLIGFLLVNPIGEFPINDDGFNKRQLELMATGDMRINAEIDTSLILQVLIGLFWSKFFGTSFLALRFLSTVFSLIFLFGTYKILKHLKIKPVLTQIVLLTVAFNPVVFTSTFTYMSETYYLAFTVWAVYFLIKYFDNGKTKDLFIGATIIGLSILIRQATIFNFAGLGLAILLVNWPLKREKLLPVVKTAMVAAIPTLIGLAVWLTWPTFKPPQGDSTLLAGVIEPKYFLNRVKILWYILPYLGFFSLPLTIGLFSSFSKRRKRVLTLFTLVLFGAVYNLDVFATGNIFYVEALYTKANFFINLSIFDNVLFKLLVAFLSTLSILSLTNFFVTHLKAIKKEFNKKQIFMASMAFTLFGFLLFASDYYERYAYPFMFVFTLLLVVWLNRLDIFKKYSAQVIFSLLLLAFMSIVHNQEYMQHTRLRWQQAYALQEKTGFVNQIHVDGRYSIYENARKQNNYDGLMLKDPSANYECFVQKYTVDTDSPVLRVATAIDESLEKFFDKPRIVDSKKYKVSRIKNNLDALVYNEEYFSPTYNLIGKKAYVGAYCLDEK